MCSVHTFSAHTLEPDSMPSQYRKAQVSLLQCVGVLMNVVKRVWAGCHVGCHPCLSAPPFSRPRTPPTLREGFVSTVTQNVGLQCRHSVVFSCAVQLFPLGCEAFRCIQSCSWSPCLSPEAHAQDTRVTFIFNIYFTFCSLNSNEMGRHDCK